MRKLFTVFAAAAMAVALSASAVAAPDAATKAKTPGAAGSKARTVRVADKKSNGSIDSRVMRTSKTAALGVQKSDFAYARAPKTLKVFAGTSMVPKAKVPAKAQGAFPNLLVSQIYDPEAVDNETFEYSVGTINASATYSALATGDEFDTTYGGFMYEGVYYAERYTDFWGFFSLFEQTAFDPETWETIDYNDEGTPDMMCTGTAVDPASGKLYRCSFNAEGSGYQLDTYDPVTYTSTPIAPLSSAYYALGFGSDGNLYGISWDGEIDSIDKTTGAVSTLFSDARLETYYVTTGALDSATDTFYYFTSPSDGAGGFFTIDLKTKSVELLCETECEYSGMAILKPLAEDGAPAAATAVSAEFEGEALSGVVKFTAPSTTFAGDALSGELSYKVLANDETVATGTVNAGAEVTADVTLAATGSYVITVVTTNSVGNSPASDKVTVWVGADAPNAPANVQLAYESGNLVLGWDAVTTTVHGGWMDVDALTYTVTRIVNGTPDGTPVTGITGTTYSVAFDEPASLMNISYQVVAVAGDAESAASESNALSFGAIVPPYTNSFASDDDLNGFTIIDANGDGKSWSISEKGARMSYNADLDMDDWLILPAVKLEAGKSYDFTIIASSQGTSFPERFEVKMGTAATAAAMTETIIASTELTTAADEEYTGTINPGSTGNYYIGVHGISDADMYYLNVREVSISAPYSAKAPDAVTDVKYIGAPSNGNEGTLTFKAPVKAVNGDALSTVDITVSADDAVVKTFTGVAAGANVSLEVSADEPTDVSYTIVASNAEGTGRSYLANVFIGPRKATAPVNVAIVETSTPGQVTVSWTPTLADVDGNPLDASAITYMLLDEDTNTIVSNIAADPAGCEYTFQAVEAGEQDFVYYFIVPETAAGESTSAGNYAYTDMIPVGKPYAMPVKESFAAGKLSYNWMTSGTSGWTIATGCNTPECEPMDTDGGMLAYNPSTTGAGASAAFLSGKIDLSGATDQTVFKFYFFPTSGASYTMQPVVVIDGEEIAVGDPIVSNSVNTTTWAPVTVSLADYAAENAQVGIRATCNAYDAVLCLDNLYIGNLLDNDLALDKISAPSNVQAGSEILVSATVVNNGANNADAYSVSLLVDGEEFENTEEAGLAAGASKTLTFAVPTDVFTADEVTLQAKVTAAADDDLTNNASETITVAVIQPSLPVATELKGEENNGAVDLSWTAPAIDTAATQINDGAEDYDDWVIDQAGDWTFIDGDGQNTYLWDAAELRFPDNGEASAFRVLNGTTLDLDITHSGDKVFACFNAVSGLCDDWMISPALAGEAQTVSFWARSLTVQYGAEEFEFMVSTTGKAPADFVRVGSVINPGEEWTEYTFDLDADVKYFAIHVISDDRFALLVDDFSFLASPGKVDLAGYNVYRNGIKLNTELVSGTNYTDTTVEAGVTYDYYVTAVYVEGESALSNKWSITTGIETISAEEAANATFYNLQGVRVNNPAAGRIYIVTEGNRARKVMVK